MTRADKIWLCRLIRYGVSAVIWGVGAGFKEWKLRGEQTLRDRLDRLAEED